MTIKEIKDYMNDYLAKNRELPKDIIQTIESNGFLMLVNQNRNIAFDTENNIVLYADKHVKFRIRKVKTEKAVEILLRQLVYRTEHSNNNEL